MLLFILKSIEQALASETINRVILTTDSKKYAKLAIKVLEK